MTHLSAFPAKVDAARERAEGLSTLAMKLVEAKRLAILYGHTGTAEAIEAAREEFEREGAY